jgi:hypothetical protein
MFAYSLEAEGSIHACPTLPDLEARVKDEPFVAHGVVSADIHEIYRRTGRGKHLFNGELPA